MRRTQCHRLWPLGEACPPKEGSLFGDVNPPDFWTCSFSTLANHFAWQTEHLVFWFGSLSDSVQFLISPSDREIGCLFGAGAHGECCWPLVSVWRCDWTEGGGIEQKWSMDVTSISVTCKGRQRMAGSQLAWYWDRKQWHFDHAWAWYPKDIRRIEISIWYVIWVSWFYLL